jgi:hypothetical protein
LNQNRTLDRALALDARSLGIARILLGAFLLVELGLRAGARPPLARHSSRPRPQLREYGGDAVLSVASAAFLVQVVLIDVAGALAALETPWWESGATTAIKLLVPVFLFVPSLRKIAAGILIATHLAEAFLVQFSLYPFLCAAMVIALVPQKEAEDDPVGSGLADALAIAATVLMLLLNVPAFFPGAAVPSLAAKLAAVVGLEQPWGLRAD